MMSIKLSHILVVVFVLVILIGLCRQRFVEVESFSVSSESDVSAGASELYGWGQHPMTHKKKSKKHKKPSSDDVDYVYRGYEIEKPKKDKKKCRKKKHCYDCDITTNKDIDKYVLKSSVPPCPDMSEYAKKSEIPPNIDLNKYILKSQIPPCDCPDLKDYIKKTEVPSCPETPLCPKCPICPVCPEMDRSKWIRREYVEKHFVRRSEVNAYCRSIARDMRKRRRERRGGEPNMPSIPQEYNNDVETPLERIGDSIKSKIAGLFSHSTPEEVSQSIAPPTNCPDYSKYQIPKTPPKPFKPGFDMNKF